MLDAGLLVLTIQDDVCVFVCVRIDVCVCVVGVCGNENRHFVIGRSPAALWPAMWPQAAKNNHGCQYEVGTLAIATAPTSAPDYPAASSLQLWPERGGCPNSSVCWYSCHTQTHTHLLTHTYTLTHTALCHHPVCECMCLCLCV